MSAKFSYSRVFKTDVSMEKKPQQQKLTNNYHVADLIVLAII